MDKVIIVGKAKGWEKAPAEGVVWGLNDLILRRNLTLLFEVHNVIPTQVIDKCNLNGTPIISLNSNHLVDNNILYPLKEIIGYLGTDLFTNTLDYMIAYAIYKGFKIIDIYGVTMGSAYEYKFQKPGLEFWVGYALGRGVKINIFGDKGVVLQINGNIPYPIKPIKIGKVKVLDTYSRSTILSLVNSNNVLSTKVYDKIKFSDEELEKLGFDMNGKELSWILSEDSELCVALSVEEQDHISSMLVNANKLGLLSSDHKSLYKEFVD